MAKWVRWIWWVMSCRHSKILRKHRQPAKRCTVCSLYHKLKHHSLMVLLLESIPRGLPARSKATTRSAKEQHTARTCHWTQLAAHHRHQMIKAAPVNQMLILKAAVLVPKQPSNLRWRIHLSNPTISTLTKSSELSRGTTMLNFISSPRQNAWVK